MTVQEIQPNELAKLDKFDLIDVRMPVEFQGLHAESAVNHPLDSLDTKQIMANRNGSSDQPLYVICQMGGRSRKACEQFIADGFPNVVNVAGGTTLWESQGLPVVKGKRQVMAMDRQVRIAAGSLVVIGAILGAALPTPYVGLAIAGAIGAGLVFSGVTNTCGMAKALALLPWNRPDKTC